MKKSTFPDPFQKTREQIGHHTIDDQNDPVTMLLRLKDVRRTAHNWQTFQSGAAPGRIVVPSEVHIRDTRQIPFETDPPLHTEYRKLVEEWFRRPLNEEYEAALTRQIEAAVEEVLQKDKTEVIRDFALPLQSRALTLLLNVPETEAETWIGWGTHVFRSEDNPLDGSKATALYDYIDREIERAAAKPSDDLYSLLLASEVQGKKLTKEEVKGVIILTFAGGRDTVINAVTNSVAYFAEHPDSLQLLREQPEITPRAIEELVRYFSPLTHMGRIVTEDTHVCEHAAKADTRVSLCWASANRDAAVFENPNEVVLDRKVNPHVAFGFSHHNCLGATHARQVLKVLLTTLAKKVGSMEILDHKDNIEQWGKFDRKVGFDKLEMRFNK